MASSLRVETSLGPVIGFADTYNLRDTSAAKEIAEGKSGGLKPVVKWLVSHRFNQIISMRNKDSASTKLCCLMVQCEGIRVGRLLIYRCLLLFIE